MLTTVRVPASSANLGPGFDALGLALNLHLECRFRRADALSIHVSGRDSHLIPEDDTNLIWQTALTVANDVGGALPSEPQPSSGRTPTEEELREALREMRRYGNM